MLKFKDIDVKRVITSILAVLTDSAPDTILQALTSDNDTLELLCRQLTYAQDRDDQLVLITSHAIGNFATSEDETIIQALM